MNKVTIRNLITSVLKEIGLYSDNAVNLLMGTAAQESRLGKYRKQIGGGPALGIFQMEPATFNDIVNNYLRYKPELAAKIERAARVSRFKAEDIENNDLLAICMARVHYLRVKKAIPSNLEGWATYWKRYYNTPLGKGKEEEFIANYKKYVQ
ncbi:MULTISPECIES: hypothetical protein [Butyricimonas]|uniref:hypothetical protein n=1 Tax=Butyricimonas TaxID=574697 RepID=UPI0007FB56A9|nr:MULTISPECIES: hypothetical protein [Butyricimonas]